MAGTPPPAHAPAVGNDTKPPSALAPTYATAMAPDAIGTNSPMPAPTQAATPIFHSPFQNAMATAPPTAAGTPPRPAVARPVVVKAQVSPGLSAAYKEAMKSPPPLPTQPYLPVKPATAGKKRGPRGGGGGKRKAQRTIDSDSPTAGDGSFLPDASVNPTPGQVPLSAQYSRLDLSDIQEARTLGVLNPTIIVSEDAVSPEYGVAYEKRGGSKASGCGTDIFPSQKALQERCKQFAMERGFQLYVSGSSSRADGGGNVKYRCKKLHGQQFFDPDTPVEQLQCPFYINGFGLGPAWKITRACFLHNHYKFIGSRLGATGQGSNPTGVGGIDGSVGEGEGEGAMAVDGAGDKLKPKPQRNTTLSTNVLCRMVNEELDKYPSSAIAMSKLDGKLIKRILLSRGHTINHMMASRIKRQIQLNRIKSIRASFQRLQGYFDLIVEKNPETGYLFDVDERAGFKRAMVLPAPTLHALKHCQKVLSFDRIRPMVWGEMEAKGLADQTEEESDDAVSGVYLYATTRDHNDQAVVIAVALVTEENHENWMWFMASLQNNHVAAMGPGWNDYTIFAGRTNGLQQAVHTVFPHSSHHLCVRRLVEEELVILKKLPLPEDKKQRIYDLARCDSEAEYKTIRQELALTNEAVVNFLDSLNRATWVKYAFLETFKKPTYGAISSDLSSGEELKTAGANPTQAGVVKSSAQLPVGAMIYPTPSAVPVLKLWFGDEVPRSSQPLAVFSRYFMKIAENFHARRKLVEQRPLPELVPRRFSQLETILQGSQRCESVPCSNGTFMVRSLAHLSTTGHDTWRHVNLLDWECTCLEWQDRLFPCVHGIHAAELNRRRIDSLYNGKVYSVEHYKMCYELGFTPWPLESASLPIDESLTIPLEELYVLDPNVKRKPGPRPKAKKILSKVV